MILSEICQELNEDAHLFNNASSYDYYENGIHVSLRNYVVAGSEDIPNNN